MTIEINATYKVAAGESVEVFDAIGFRFDNPTGSLSRLINAGTLTVSYDGPFSMYAVVDYQDEPAMIWNRAGARFVVETPHPDGSATGFQLSDPGSSFTNDGEFIVSGGHTGEGGSVGTGTGFANAGLFQVTGGAYANGLAAFQTDSVVNTGVMRIEGGSAKGVHLSTRSTFANSGELEVIGAGQAIGVQTSEVPPEHGWMIQNSGRITATQSAGVWESIALKIEVGSYQRPAYVLHNRGYIEADVAVDGRNTSYYPDQSVQVYLNTGEIRGDFRLAHENDQIKNKGLIVGDLDLGGGFDVIDSHRGRIVGSVMGGAGNDTLIGGKGADVLYGDGPGDADPYGFDQLSGEKGNDRLYGGNWHDTLDGGAGSDTLYGGAHEDRFVFTDAAHSTVARPDLIADLGNTDRIDLSAIDANTLLSGDQAFLFVDDFTGHRGQARLVYDAGAGLTRLELDINGDAQADSLVLIAGDWTDFARFVA